jgi:Tfp pilus assembly protein PilO
VPPAKWTSWRLDLLGVLCCAAITAIGFFAVARPMIVQRLEKAALLAEIEDRRGRTGGLRQVEALLSGQREKLRQRTADGDLELQPPGYLNTRMALIVDLASATGITIDETRSGAASAGEFYQTVPITLSGTGSYTDCAAYLHELHKMLPDTGVVFFELSGNPGSPGAAARFRFDLVWLAAPALM